MGTHGWMDGKRHGGGNGRREGEQVTSRDEIRKKDRKKGRLEKEREMV